MQLSCVSPPELVVGCTWGTAWVKVGTDPGVPDVGKESGVLVGGDVGLGVFVGGIGVVVGTAA